MAKISEIDAMKVLDEALGGLDTETRERVMSWALSKFSVQGGVPKVEQPRAPQPQPAPQALKFTDIKTFMAQKKPETSYEQVACLCNFVEKYEQKATVTIDDVTEANDRARWRKLSNAPQSLKHAVHMYGYLVSLAKGNYGVSARGEALVEALPDRAKVEEALAHHPFSRKGKKKWTTKKR